MTLRARPAWAAAERALELIATVEAAPEADQHELALALAAVLRVWDDQVDAQFFEQITQFIDVLADIARILDVDDVDQAAATINAWLTASASAPRLVQEPGWGWHLHLDADDADWPSWLLSSTAHGFALMLAEHGRLAWGRCRSRGCGRPFLDHGRRQPQRFCSTTCATRERVRRHRASA